MRMNLFAKSAKVITSAQRDEYGKLVLKAKEVKVPDRIPIFADDNIDLTDEEERVLTKYTEIMRKDEPITTPIPPEVRASIEKSVKELAAMGHEDFKRMAEMIDRKNAGISTEEAELAKELVDCVGNECKETVNTLTEIAFRGTIDDDYALIRVDVHMEEGFETIMISAGSPHGPINIPMYVKLDVPSGRILPIHDSRNRWFDWLCNLKPNIIFTTADPDRWIDLCNDDITYSNAVKCIILGKHEGKYVMGLYLMEGIFVTDGDSTYEDNGKMIQIKINGIVMKNIYNSSMSYLNIAMADKDSWVDESYVEGLIVDEDDVKN